MAIDNCPCYQFRRIGDQATLRNVKDVVRLDKELVSIGRHVQSDFFLDSRVLKNFISRKHADTLQKSAGEFILRDYGLNGSYVNDVRVDGSRRLQEGDIVKFGHTQGMHIPRGAFAPQSTMEFTFVFEKVPASSQTQNREVLSRNVTRDISQNENDNVAAVPAAPLRSILRSLSSPGSVAPKRNHNNKENRDYVGNGSITDILKDAKSLNMSEIVSADNSVVADSQDGVDGDSSHSSPIEEISNQLSTHLKPRYSSNTTLEFPRVSKLPASSPTIPLIGRNGETPTELVKGYQPRRLMQETPNGKPIWNFFTHSVGVPLLQAKTDLNSSTENGRDDAPDLSTDEDLASLAANAVNNYDSDIDIFDAEVAVVTPKPTIKKKEENPDAILSPQDLLKQVRANLSSIENKLSSHGANSLAISPTSQGDSPALQGKKLSPSSQQSSGSTQDYPRLLPPINIVPFCVKQSTAETSSGHLEAAPKVHRAIVSGSAGHMEASPKVQQAIVSGSAGHMEASPKVQYAIVSGSAGHMEASPKVQQAIVSGSAGHMEASPKVHQAVMSGNTPQEHMAIDALVTMKTKSSGLATRWLALSPNSGTTQPKPQPTLGNLWTTPVFPTPEPVHTSSVFPTPELVHTSSEVEMITPDSQGIPKSQRNSKRKSAQGAGNAKKKSGRSSSTNKGLSSKKKRKPQEQKEDPKYDYQCDSFDCIRPIDSLISWVQCDDCDKWYHTSCVGCRYEQVQDEHTEFHCGCR